MAYKNPEDLIAYRNAHRVEARERSRRWRLAHPGANAGGAKKWRKENPEKAAEANRLWRTANKDRLRARQKAWRERVGYSKSLRRKEQSFKDGLRVHGLTVDEYRKMLAAQNNGCAICLSSAPRMKNAKRMYVDHDHVTDEVRGLLCHRCNLVLGAADDSPERLRSAARYLEGASGGVVRGSRRGLLEPR